jgi:hypothetical protein
VRRDVWRGYWRGCGMVMRSVGCGRSHRRSVRGAAVLPSKGHTWNLCGFICAPL